LTAAGVLFSGLGWAGLAAAVLLLLLCAARPVFLLMPAAVSFVSLAAGIVPLAPPPGWVGVDTALDYETGHIDHLATYYRQISLVARARASDGRVVVFPESAAGHWNAAAQRLWAGAAGDRIFLTGAEIHDAAGYDNALVLIDREGARPIYRQRMPVPLTMWRPWAADSARAHWFAQPQTSVAGKRVGIVMCYEAFLVWPALQSASGADVLVTVGNDWWARGTRLPDIHLAAMSAWARLFDVPLVSALNR
jgi:apolipoprotein N-acyltransferase